jgi:hypothetical protein
MMMAFPVSSTYMYTFIQLCCIAGGEAGGGVERKGNEVDVATKIGIENFWTPGYIHPWLHA